jgi:hypothetical protein
VYCCSRIAEAEAAVSVNEQKLLVMRMHVQLKLDDIDSASEIDSVLFPSPHPMQAHASDCKKEGWIGILVQPSMVPVSRWSSHAGLVVAAGTQ